MESNKVIYRVYSTLPKFKELRFEPSLNVLLADTSEGASEFQTRNRAGKSSLVELIHFLLGAQADKDSLFKNEALVKCRFGMEFDLQGSRTVVERSGENSTKIVVKQAASSSWPIKPEYDAATGDLVISNTHWRTVLGSLMFDVNLARDGEQAGRFGPTSRSLFSYFARRQSANAFSSPFKQSEKQQPYDKQVAIMYLLGLDWTIAQQWQEMRERRNQLKQLRKAASDEALGYVVGGTTATLRTQLAVAEEDARSLRDSVQRFRVLPEYRPLETEATQITRTLGAMSNKNTIDRELLADLRQSLEREFDPPAQNLERLYEEVGVVLPGAALRRFSDVQKFHRSVTENRRLYLSGEIEEAENRIAHREIEMSRLDTRRAEIMRILDSHGALDQFNRLRQELTLREAKTEDLRRRFAAAEQLEGQETELDIERQQLLRRLRQNYREQQDTLNQAIVAFEETSRALYEQAGNLTVEGSDTGPKFEVKIQGAKSKGISNMQIFCFDMMLMRLCSDRGIGPTFLIHDSHLFDGVDERQVATALQLGTKIADEYSFQYIVTMNSDAVPTASLGNFSLGEHILPVKLTDATEEGGLFGLRF